MKTSLILGAVLLLASVGLADSPPDDGKEASSLEALRSEIEKAIPKGWSVKVQLVEEERPSLRYGPRPTLVITSEAPLSLEYGLPGMAPGSEPYRTSEVVTVYVIAVPFLTPEKYAFAREDAEKSRKQRLDFEKERLKGVPYVYKGSDPFPPQAYQPRSDREKRLVIEYAFLWLRTETRSLPTHHTRDLSFVLSSDTFMIIRDERKAHEYQGILESVQKLVVPYEKS